MGNALSAGQRFREEATFAGDAGPGVGKLLPYSVDEKALHAVLIERPELAIAEARLDYMESSQLLNHYISKMVDQERVHLTFLPTQASGRWSVKNPPLVNFPKHLRDVVVPDQGWVWRKFDYSAIEARLAAAYSRDEEDLGHFSRGHDIHTITACKALKWEMPPSLIEEEIASSPVCQAWRDRYHWGYDCTFNGSGHEPGGGLSLDGRYCHKVGHKDDRRRVAFKTARYALVYAKTYKSILQAKDAHKFGDPELLLKMGKAYYDSKPRLMAWKRRVWAECVRTRESRTFLGTRRRLPLGNSKETLEKVEKEGLNHKIQGAVANIVNWVIVQVDKEFPQSILALNAHDSLMWHFPKSQGTETTWARLREIVEETEWDVEGVKMTFPAEWVTIEAPEHG